jgi:hypothetical protein
LLFLIFTFVFYWNHKDRNRREDFAQDLFVTGAATAPRFRAGGFARPASATDVAFSGAGGQDAESVTVNHTVYGRTNHHLPEMQK